MKTQGKRELRRQIKAYKQEIIEMIEPYFKYTTGKMPKEDRYSGQLKCYKDELIVRNLAVSTDINMSYPLKKVTDYLEQNITLCDQDVIDFFDPEKNIRAYINSFYCCDWVPAAVERYSLQIDSPMFLLLEKVQKVMEQKFFAYKNTPMFVVGYDVEYKEEEDDEKENNKEDGLNSEQKNEAEDKTKKRKPSKKQENYLEFLHSVALYEIFLDVYWNKRKDVLLKTNLDVISEFNEWLNHRNDEMEACTDMQKRKEMVQESAGVFEEKFKNCFQELVNMNEMIHIRQRMQELFAMLKIIYVIEGVQGNTGREENCRGNGARIIREEVTFWRKNMEKAGLFCSDKDVFWGIERRNLKKAVSTLNEVNCKCGNVYQVKENDKKIRLLVADQTYLLKHYISCLEDKQKAGAKWTMRQENNLREWEKELADPLILAANEILYVYQNMPKTRIKSKS